MFDSFIAKLLVSSKNPSQLSLTIKGVLVGFVPLLMLLTGLTEADINALIDTVVQVAFYATAIISAVQVAYGLPRKIQMGRWTSWRG